MSRGARGRVFREPVPGLGRGRTVPLGEADRELRLSWAAIDEDSRRADGEGMLRLREVNLVAVTGEADLERSRVTAAVVAREHPGRVIVLAPGESGSTASVATGCLLDGPSKRRVCSEEVVIRGAQDDEERLQSAVLQLLVPDVPVVGWWTGDLGRAGPELLWLAEVVDQLVTDLSTADPSAALAAASALLREGSDLALRDLEWMRIAPWRELTAELFERADRRLLIPRIERIEIRHREALMQALLLASWFATRLDLSPAGAEWSWDGGRLLLRLRGRAPASVTFTLTPEGRSETERGLVDLDIAFRADVGDGDAGAGECSGRVISVSRSSQTLVCRCGTRERPGGPVLKSVAMPDQQDACLISQVIDTPGREPAFDEAVTMATVLWGLVGPAAESAGGGAVAEGGG